MIMISRGKKGRDKTRLSVDKAKSKYLISSLEYELRLLRQRKSKVKKQKKGT